MSVPKPKTICNNCSSCPCKTGESPLFHYRNSPDLAVWYGRGGNNVSHSTLYRPDEFPQTIEIILSSPSGSRPTPTTWLPTITTSTIMSDTNASLIVK